MKAASALALTLGACLSTCTVFACQSAEDGGGEVEGGGKGPAAEPLYGSYELSTFFDLTDAAILPDIANDTLSALSGLKESPSRTIIDLLKASNAPVVSNVLGIIPQQLLGPFEGFIDDYLFSRLFEGVPATETVASLIDDIASLVTHFEVITVLDMPEPDEFGNSVATHQLTGLGFTLLGNRFVVDSPEFLSELTGASEVSCNIAHLYESSPLIETGRVDIGDHGFGLPIGHYVLAAVDKVLQEQLGVEDLRGALGLIVDCRGLAQAVAGRCIGPLCIGHETEIFQLCDAGLGIIVAQVEERVLALDFQAIHLAGGDAKMWDAAVDGDPLDGLIDRIDQGQWIAGIDVGSGEKSVSASFVGRRIGDSQAPPVN